MIARVGLACLLLALGSAAGARAQEPELPAAGLQAEAAGDWDRAVEVYSQAAAESGRADLWVRISRIEATRDHPREALAAIDRALALEPDDVDHLRARAELASWAGDYETADESWRRVAERTGEPLATLQRARIAAWQGRIAPAVEHYHAYLRSVPDDSVATIELVRQETWRGNARAALGLLDVVVCDGFVGNIVLKFYESVARLIVRLVRDKAPEILKRGDVREVLRILDYSEYGGAPLLGVRGVSIICHGSSSPNAIRNALRGAVRAVQTGLDRHIGAEFAARAGAAAR